MKQPARPLRAALAACTAAVALAGCGGGDAGVPIGAFDADLAWRNLLAANTAFNLSGIGSDGNGYTLTVALVPGGAGAYPLTGEVGATGVQQTTLSVSGTPFGTSVTTQFYDAASARLIGVRSDDSSCATVTAQGVLPVAAAIGSAGVLYDATSFDRCDGAAVATGTVLADWSLEAEDGIAFFCVSSEQRDAFGAFEFSEQDCVAIDSNGTLGPFARVTVVIPGQFTLVARNY